MSSFFVERGGKHTNTPIRNKNWAKVSYIKIKQGIYGRNQAVVLAYNHLSTLLIDARYAPIIGSMGVYKHNIRKVFFNLCVDDSIIKCFDKKDVQNLIQTIQSKYQVKCDWTGSNLWDVTSNKMMKKAT